MVNARTIVSGMCWLVALLSSVVCVAGEPGDEAELAADAPAEAAADLPVEKPGKHCLGEQKTRVTLRQHVAAQYNATGLEHHARLGVCTPLIETPGMLYDLTHVEAGVLTYFTPAYFQTGGYLEIIPLAPLVLRAELNSVNYFPFRAFNRAGYVPRDSYDQTFDNADVPAELSESASGFNANLLMIPRIAVGFSDSWGIVALAQMSLEYWDVGHADYYVNLRRDVIAAQSEAFFTAETIVLAEWKQGDDLKVRFGGYDAYRTVLGSGYEANQVGAMAMVNWPKPFESTYDLSLFLRGGVYTEHAFRELEPTFLGGMFVSHAWADLD